MTLRAITERRIWDNHRCGMPSLIKFDGSAFKLDGEGLKNSTLCNITLGEIAFLSEFVKCFRTIKGENARTQIYSEV